MRFPRMLVALAIPLMLCGTVLAEEAVRKGPPGETPSGTQPAVPGGGNPNARSENAATPADPGRAPDIGDFNDSECGNFAESHAPDIRGEAGERWGQMGPADRERLAAENPRLKRCVGKAWQEMTPPERGAFMRAHPGLRERLRERWAAMKEGDRGTFLQRHPAIRKRCGCGGGQAMQKPDRPRPGNKGVRDHGKGQGRDGVGQGGERRKEGAGTRGGANRPGRGAGGKKN